MRGLALKVLKWYAIRLHRFLRILKALCWISDEDSIWSKQVPPPLTPPHKGEGDNALPFNTTHLNKEGFSK